jgi:hypothetical protein
VDPAGLFRTIFTEPPSFANGMHAEKSRAKTMY